MFKQIKEVTCRCYRGCHQPYHAILVWISILVFLITKNPAVGLVFAVLISNAAQGVQPNRDRVSDFLMLFSLSMTFIVLIGQYGIFPGVYTFTNLQIPQLAPFNLSFEITTFFIALSFYPLLTQFIKDQKSSFSTASLIFLTCLCTVFASGLIVAGALLVKSIKFKFMYPSYIVIWLVHACWVGFSEEVIYRGILQNVLTHFFRGHSAPAIVIAALVYGYSNIGLGTDVFLLTAVSGLFYGILYLASRQLRYPVILHVLLSTMYLVFFSAPLMT